MDKIAKIHKQIFEETQPILDLIEIKGFFQIKIYQNHYFFVSNKYTLTKKLITNPMLIGLFVNKVMNYSFNRINIMSWSIIDNKIIKDIYSGKSLNGLSFIFNCDNVTEIFSFNSTKSDHSLISKIDLLRRFIVYFKDKYFNLLKFKELTYSLDFNFNRERKKSTSPDQFILNIKESDTKKDSSQILLMIKKGETIEAISKKTGLTRKQVEYRINKLKKEIKVFTKYSMQNFLIKKIHLNNEDSNEYEINKDP